MHLLVVFETRLIIGRAPVGTTINKFHNEVYFLAMFPISLLIGRPRHEKMSQAASEAGASKGAGSCI
jgi:hypothetical protein